jgi:glycine/D-amino acid oxidase-like deaminating enzyme/nitrite reductase/ring-hydroxylating ferredoxin subunit
MKAETKSIWEDTAAEEAGYPKLEGKHEIDIVVVGGGITGITAALLLSKAGRKVMLLEGQRIGLGTTGNSTGNLYVTVDEHLSHIRRKWNADVMKSIVKSRESALNFIESCVKQYKIDCDFRKVPFTYFAESLDNDIKDFIEDEFDALKECGLNPKMAEKATLPYKTVKSLSAEGQAQFHPLKYVRELAKIASEKASIYEESRVTDIDQKEGIVKTDKAEVRANHILLATHSPVGAYMVHTLMAPYREFGVAAELKDGDFPSGINWGMNKPKHSIRSFENKGKNYVMVIGDKFKTGQHGDTHKYIQGLKDYLKERVNISDFKYVWGGQHYRSFDGLPYIGRHNEKVYFMTGFATDGLIYGTLAAMMVSDLVLEISNPWEEIYKVTRFTPIKSAKDFIVEGADTLGQYMKDVPWNVDADALREVKRGEAKILVRNQEKIAVYKDENGENHIISAVCTHMKCIVNWNQSEMSWDCPCHGSRFTIDGDVIEGPAIVNLPPKK